MQKEQLKKYILRGLSLACTGMYIYLGCVLLYEYFYPTLDHFDEPSIFFGAIFLLFILDVICAPVFCYWLFQGGVKAFFKTKYRMVLTISCALVNIPIVLSILFFWTDKNITENF